MLYFSHINFIFTVSVSVTSVYYSKYTGHWPHREQTVNWKGKMVKAECK